jgi:hypothetical protein
MPSAGQFGFPKVCKFDAQVMSYQNIGWFDISVNDMIGMQKDKRCCAFYCHLDLSAYADGFVSKNLFNEETVPNRLPNKLIQVSIGDKFTDNVQPFLLYVATNAYYLHNIIVLAKSNCFGQNENYNTIGTCN